MLSKGLPPLGLAGSRPCQEHFGEIGKLTMSNLHSFRMLEVLEVSMLVEKKWWEGVLVLEVSMLEERDWKEGLQVLDMPENSMLVEREQKEGLEVL